MTSTLLQQTQTTTTTQTAAAAASAAEAAATAATAMAWSNEKIRLACVDNMGLRQLWKLIALDTNKGSASNSSSGSNGSHQNGMDNKQQKQHQQQHQHQQLNHISYNNNNNNSFNNNNNNNNEKLNIENRENFADYLSNRDILPHSHMSLLKFLAINALELSAPASPVLLQQKHAPHASSHDKPKGWMQLSGHPESIVPTTAGIVRKRIASLADAEVRAYEQLSAEPLTAAIVPQFYGSIQLHDSSELFIELQDLLAGFKDPCVMDIKMGCRTFLESEVSNQTLRPDLYKKMMAVDATAPSAEEHAAQAITKLRYMLFREALSSSHTKAFRIEALRMRGRSPQKDLKTVRSSEQIEQTFAQFLSASSGRGAATAQQLLQQLRHMRSVIEQSAFFARHEIVGSSIFIVYDEERVGAWLIDFAKSRELPAEVCVTHRSDWQPGNREEGLLRGMDELIASFERVQERHPRKCLQI